MLKADLDSKKHIKSRGKLYIKYFVVITSMLLICITLAGSLIMLFVSENTKKDKLQTLGQAVNEVSDSALAQFKYYYDSGWDTEVGKNIGKTICTELKTYSFALDSDFFLASAKDGSVVYCKEMLTEGYLFPFNCPIHKDIIISQDSLYRSNDPSRSVYIGNLDGVFKERHFIASAPIVFSHTDGEDNEASTDTVIAYVFATQSVDIGLRSYINRVFKILVFSSFVAFFISLITVYFLSYSMTKPLSVMLDATKRYSKGDFSFRVPVRGNDELAELTLAFNSMADSLALLESSRRSFVANVSHELKTPMTSIAGFIDGMLDGTISDEAQKQKYLNIVSDEVKRLSRLIASMLNMSKIEAGELKISKNLYNITEQIIYTLINFEKILEDKNISIIGLDEMPQITLYADKDMISQVIYNLIDNAVKFTPKGGNISFKAYIEADEAVIKIKNFGVGLAMEDFKKVFERFYKVDKSRSADTKSVGLGLYIVKSILDLHDGQITVDSKENEYVEFSIRLPMK